MSAAQILRQAEELKTAVKDTSKGANEAWISRQNLQDLYQKLLVLDLEYALDKKVEQDLWNHAFKNQISMLQTQSKDKQNPKRPEILASLSLFLETGSGFYLQLLEELCSAFKLDLPCRRKATAVGILKEYGPVASKIKAPKKSSCMYICQHCLVHLGDIARYREQMDQAHSYYKHAAQLVPYNGQPYNQLAILEAAKGNKLSTVVYYVRSIAVKHPFPVAITNLEKFYTKITKDIPETGKKLSLSEMTLGFLQFNALVHLCAKLEVAKTLSDKILSSLPSHITSFSFSSHQLVQMVTVLLYTVSHCEKGEQPTEGGKQKGEQPQDDKLQRVDDNEGEQPEKGDKNNKEKEACEGREGKNAGRKMSTQEKTAYDIIFTLTVCFLDLLLSVTPMKQETKAKEFHTLAAIKVLLDWLRTDMDLINRAQFRNSTICHNLSKLLNVLQFNNNQKDVPINMEKYGSVPLPEDCELRCFTPLQNSHSELQFQLMPVEGLSPEVEMRLRCQRLIEHGLWLCDEFPSLNLINVQKQKTGRLHFSAPASQVKIMPGSDSDGGSEKKSSSRQNVAITAIMEKKAKSDGATDPKDNIPAPAIIASNQGNQLPNVNKPHGKSNRKNQHGDKSPQKSEAGFMVHISTETQEPQEKPIPSDAWDETSLQHGIHPHQNHPPPTSLPQPFPNWAASAADQALGKPRLPQDGSAAWHGQGSANFQGQRGIGGDPNRKQDPPQGENMAHDRMAFGKDSFPTVGPFIAPNSQKPSAEPEFSRPIKGKDQAEHFQQQQQHLQYVRQMQGKGHPQLSRDAQLLDPYYAQQQQKSDALRQELQQVDKRILQTSEQLRQLSQQIQQRKQAVQQDKEIQVLQQQLQQMTLQLKQLDARQQQQLQQIIIQHEAKLQQKFQQIQEVLAREVSAQQQLQQQQQQLLQRRQVLDLQAKQQQQQQQRRPSNPEKLGQGLDHWPQVPSTMDLSQMLAVIESNKQPKAQGQGWDSQGHGQDDNRAGGRPTTLPQSTRKLQEPNRPGFSVDLKSPEVDFQRYQYSPLQPSQLETTATKSYLENIFQRPTEQESAPGGAYIPTSDTEEEMRQVGERFNKMSSMEGKSPSHLSPSLGVALNLCRLAEELQSTSGSPTPARPPVLGSTTEENTYSLFSQSPWTVQLTSGEPKSHTSSPFGSSTSSSLRTTPDPHPSQQEDRPTPTPTAALGGGLSYIRPPPVAHPNQDEQPAPSGSLGGGLGYSRAGPGVDVGWGAPAKTHSRTDEVTTAGNVGLAANIQSIWSAGPSPLQKLLEQQKNQRQNDPH